MKNDVLRLSQIAIAIPEIETIRERLSAIGFEIESEHEVETEKVKAAMVRPQTDEQLILEFLEPTSQDSPIAKFLEKRKHGGLHHIGFAVNNINTWKEKLVQAGFELIPPGIRPGARGKVLFIHPKSMGGVLVELEEMHPEAVSKGN